jgi:Kef-type K+ transport system membrane component KefB
MSFATLAVVVLAGLLGPLLALPKRWHVPVVVGELAAGVLLGPTVADYLNPANPTFSFPADLGFALVMFVAGSHVPIRDERLRAGLRTGAARAVAVGAVAVLTRLRALPPVPHRPHRDVRSTDRLLFRRAGPPHGRLPSPRRPRTARALLDLLPQVAIADTVCIVAVPLAVDPAHAGRAALGALAVIACAAAGFLALSRLDHSGVRRRLHKLSEERKFALELRFSLAALCGLAALATLTHVSIMLAGFSLGLAVAAVGEPRRLARQLFGVTEGFFGPLFFL